MRASCFPSGPASHVARPDRRRLTGRARRIIRGALRSCRSQASSAWSCASQDPSISGFFHRYPAPLAGGRPTGFRQSGTGHEDQEFHQGLEVAAPRQPRGASPRPDLRHQQDAAPLQGTPGLIPGCHGCCRGRVFSITLKIAVIRANITAVEFLARRPACRARIADDPAAGFSRAGDIG
jgi:hypothetical protein